MTRRTRRTRRRGGEEEEEDEAGGRRQEEATDIKSNNPHLAGGESPIWMNFITTSLFSLTGFMVFIGKSSPR